MSPALPRPVAEMPTTGKQRRTNWLRIPPVRMRWDGESTVHVLDSHGVRQLSATFGPMHADIYIVGAMGQAKDLRSCGGDRESATALIVAAGYVLSANPHIAIPKAKHMGTRWRIKRDPTVLAVIANHRGKHVATPICVYPASGEWRANVHMLVRGKRRTFVVREHSMTAATLVAIACLVSAI